MDFFEFEYQALQLLIDEGHPNRLEEDVFVRLGAQKFDSSEPRPLIDARRELFVDHLQRPAGRYADPITAPVQVSLVFSGNPEATSIEELRLPGWEFRLYSTDRPPMMRVAGVLAARLERTNAIWFPQAETWEDGLFAVTLALRPG